MTLKIRVKNSAKIKRNINKGNLCDKKEGLKTEKKNLKEACGPVQIQVVGTHPQENMVLRCPYQVNGLFNLSL